MAPSLFTSPTPTPTTLEMGSPASQLCEETDRLGPRPCPPFGVSDLGR